MKEKALSLLKKLTEAHGAPSREEQVRAIFCEEVPHACEADRLGNMTCAIKGSGDAPRILVSGHMDEVGLMVHSITNEGLLRFVPVGGWWGHVLLAQRMRVLTQDNREIVGVITAKPPHFLSPAEREKVLSLDAMYIDVGAKDKKEATEDFGIRLGDTIVPDSSFTPMHNPDLLLCKAFDNRVGMALTIHSAQLIAQDDHPNTVYATATVQEELGLRGAKTVGELVNPDVALILEGPPADDLPGVPSDERQGVLGGGVQLRLIDPTAVSNHYLSRFVIRVAEEENIPHQVTVRRSGGTDAGALHLYKHGVPTLVLGVPARYIHTANSIINIHDYLAALQLIRALVKRMDAETVASFTPWK
ncbi:MAG: M42 family metallopeptidase [Myxococcales bacterium]|nr:M42 family metallopeptidase [Myxococcales bacterium]